MRLLPVIGLLLVTLACNTAQAATVYTADSAGRNDVQAKVDLAVSGDTVNIPAGEAWWTTNVTSLNKAITIQGAGTNSTIIHDELPNAYRASVPSLFNILTTNLDQTFRLSGFKTVGPTTNNTTGIKGTILIRSTAFWNSATNSIAATNAPWRLDHIWMVNPKNRPGYLYSLIGLVDNCRFELTSSGFAVDGRISSQHGHESWNRPYYLGTTAEGIYFDNNYITNSAASHAIVDVFAGGRYVARSNVVYNASWENHGTESTLLQRGGFWMHIIGNIMINVFGTGERAILFRSGSGIIEGNFVTNYTGLIRMVNYRDGEPYSPWRIACGTNGWDFNDTTGGSLSDGVYGSGTHTGGNNTVTMVDTNANWTTDQWRGHHLINRSSGSVNLATPPAGIVSANTSNTVTLYGGAYTSPTSGVTPGTVGFVHWTNGNSYEFRKIVLALDQPGLGSPGGLLTGVSDTIPPTPLGWPSQTSVPIISYNNFGVTNGSADASAGGYHITTPRDYYLTPSAPAVPRLPWPHPFASGVTLVYPTISTITNRTIAHDTNTGAIPITIGAGTTTIANYIMSYSSSNPTLVPNGATNVVFGGSGANRTMTVYPAAGQSGTVILAVLVTDEYPLSASTSFTLTVVAGANNAPMIATVANQSMDLSSTTGPLAFTVGDVETAAASLTVTRSSSDINCIPLANVVLGGSGANRTVTVTSGTNYGFSVITLTVSDGSDSSISTFTASVPAPGTSGAFRATTVRAGSIIFSP